MFLIKSCKDNGKKIMKIIPSEWIGPQSARKGYLVEQLVKFFELMCTSFLEDAGDL